MAPPSPKNKTRSRSAIVVNETAASTRPRRVAKNIIKEVGESVAQRSATRSANEAKTTDTSKATGNKGKVDRLPKRKAGKEASEQTTSDNNARKRTKTANTEPNGKHEDEANPKVNHEEAREVDVDDKGAGKSYWLMKAEPESRFEKGVDVKFSIDDLREAKEPEAWDGVRNATARNHMRAMKKGDLAFFYHSNCKVPGIAGTMEIVREHSVDESAFDPAHPYYDAKSSRDNPKWEVVHVEFRSKFQNLVTLAELKSLAKPGDALENLQMLKQSRLSVSPVRPEEWRFIMSLAEEQDIKI
uniref:Thymocyte nuclear protein 1 n=1 Tax=Coccidioides posadasii RMSCC 3488 TaxID=454284 RepID=A0A0J6FDV1_COCPO|nr:3SC1 protein [Coccidioides posadasii RMSCC 3488]